MGEIPQNDQCWSWLHRCLGRTPGTLPKWFLSSSNSSVDAVSAGYSAIVVSAVAASVGVAISFGLFDRGPSGYVVTGLLVVLISASIFVRDALIEPCRTIERKARAISRRDMARSDVVNPPGPTPDASS